MEYRICGKTGLKVSALSFGASSLGGVFGTVDETEGARTVRTALDAGVNLLDVSPFYGKTRAEAALGRALRGCPRDSFLLATKVGRYDMEAFDFSAARVQRSVEESLERLGVDCIDLIQCHDIEFGSLDQVVEETLPALRKLRDEGKVRFIGITGLPLTIYPAVLDRTQVDMVLSYCHYTLHDESLIDLLPYLESKGVGVLNAAPLAMGLLTRQGPPDWHPADPQLRAACAQAARFCWEQGVEIERVALQFALAEPRIASTVIGTSRPEEMERNLRWSGERPDPALLAAVQEILKPVHNRTWPSGRPENNR